MFSIVIGLIMHLLFRKEEQAKAEAALHMPEPEVERPLWQNAVYFATIMKEILEKTATRAFLLPTFTHGYSVDNAIHEKMFKAIEVWKAIQENAVTDKIAHSQLIIPGIADSEKNSIRQLTRWNVLVGPVSGFLIPLYLMENGLWMNKNS